MSERGPIESVAIYSGGEIIGDGVYKLPFLRALRAGFPGAHISWICPGPTVYQDRIAPLVSDLLDDIRPHADIGKQMTEFLRPVSIKTRFDLVLDTQQVVWRTLCARRLRHGVFISGCADFLFSDIKPPRGHQRPAHILKRFIGMMEMVTGQPAPALERGLTLPAALEAKAEAQLPDGPEYIGFAPGAGQAVKRWPLERFIEIARRQEALGRVPVFILGPVEAAEMPAIRDAIPTALFPEQDTALWGDQFDPMRTMAIGRRLAGALSNDSGVSHMLAAADTPIVVLYGPTSADKFGPITRRARFIEASHFGAAEMAAIPVEPVAQAMEELLRPAA